VTTGFRFFEFFGAKKSQFHFFYEGMSSMGNFLVRLSERSLGGDPQTSIIPRFRPGMAAWSSGIVSAFHQKILQFIGREIESRIGW
jgi:hypothetical protein